MNISDAFDKSIKAITKIDYKDNNKEDTKKESVAADAQHTPTSLSQQKNVEGDDDHRDADILPVHRHSGGVPSVSATDGAVPVDMGAMPTATLNVENSPVAVENSANSHIANGATKKPRRRKNERDDVTQKRIDDVYDAMDAFKKKVMDNPAAKYRRDEKATSEIEQMLSVAPAPSPKYLNLVAYDMWNQKDSKTGEQFWRDKMSPYNIAHQYETRI